jgi:hypothetical protein
VREFFRQKDIKPVCLASISKLFERDFPSDAVVLSNNRYRLPDIDNIDNLSGDKFDSNDDDMDIQCDEN